MWFNPNGLPATSGYVLAKDSTGKFGLVALSTVPAVIESAAVNTVLRAHVLHRSTTGVAAAGIGAQLAFTSEDAAGTTTDVASIDAALTNVGVGTEASTLLFRTRTGGAALAECMKVDVTSLVCLAGTAPEIRATGAAADIDVLITPKGTGAVNVGDSHLTGANKITVPAASAEFGIATVPVGGSVAVALATIGANDVVLPIPQGDSTGAAGVGTSIYVTKNAGVGFTINCKPVPAAQFDCMYAVIHRS